MSTYISRWSLLLVITLCSIVAITYYRLHPEPQSLDLVFDPAHFDLTDQVFFEHGPPIDVCTSLINRSSTPLEITALQRGCSCTSVKTDPLPHTLQPGESFPVKVQIDLSRRSGIQSFGLWPTYRTIDGAEIPSTPLDIRAYVIKTLTSIPDQFVDSIDEDDNPKILKHTFVLADDWPDLPEFELGVHPDHPDITHYALKIAHGQVGWGPYLLKKRFELEVTYTPPPHVLKYHETITLTPSNPKAPPLSLKLRSEVTPAIVVEPKELLLYSTVPTESRLVDFRFRNPKYADVSCSTDVSWLKVSRERTFSSTVRFCVTCTLPPTSSTTNSRLVFTADSGRKTVIVPVTYVITR